MIQNAFYSWPDLGLLLSLRGALVDGRNCSSTRVGSKSTCVKMPHLMWFFFVVVVVFLVFLVMMINFDINHCIYYFYLNRNNF